jgi:hypothetical protein
VFGQALSLGEKSMSESFNFIGCDCENIGLPRHYLLDKGLIESGIENSRCFEVYIESVKA